MDRACFQIFFYFKLTLQFHSWSKFSDAHLFYNLAQIIFDFFIWVVRSGPLLFHDHLRSVFLNIVMKLMLQIRSPLSISSLLPLLSISFWLKKIDGARRWKNWIDGTRRWWDLNPRPPHLIHDELDHRIFLKHAAQTNYYFFATRKIFNRKISTKSFD